VPAPSVSLTFSAGVAALEHIEEARKAREDRMRNALEILADVQIYGYDDPKGVARFVRATAREGLGRGDT
jgi:hypothetical protein